MKSILNNIFLICSVLLVVSACNDSTSVSTNVTEVQNLYTPEDGYSVTLDPNGTETFEWEPAKAQDGGLVMYEVAFDSVGGDFSDPIYRVPSDNNGIATTASVSHGTLNKAAAQAGLEAEETGELDWTVITSRGVNEKVSPQANTMQVTRLAGFANPPTNLYITGGGTEAGGNLADAMQLKSVGEGQFEIYTELTTDGSYKFVNNTTGSPREFIIDGNTISESAQAPTVSQNGVYRINLDFTTGSAEMVQVTNVEFFSSAHGNSNLEDGILFELNYQGEGIFTAENQNYSFYDWGSFLDSRYKFRLTLNVDGEEIYEWIGNDEADVGNPNDTTPDSYWYLYPVPESADIYQYTFKMNTDNHQSIIDMTVDLGAENYTHTVTKVGDQ